MWATLQDWELTQTLRWQRIDERPPLVCVLSMWPLVYLVAIVGVVMMWRGLWGLFDEYLWPNKPKLSYWTTFLAGFAVLIALFAFVPV